MRPYVENVPEPPDCPYELLAEIGSGGCATVYNAIHPDRPFQAVAVKVPKPSPLTRERFRREIDALRRLDHPHVMPLIAASARDEWYAMPLADISLRTLGKECPGDWEGLRVALSAVSGALMHAHAHEIFHRDLSPENVLATVGRHWLLADFGLARFVEAPKAITPPGAAFGAADFAAPEVRRDPRSATAASDVYSLGALARWFTGIGFGQTGLSVRGGYWSKLIEGTMTLIAAERWSLSQTAYHLEHPPVERVVSPSSSSQLPCLRCGGTVDLNGRCLDCGLMDEG